MKIAVTLYDDGSINHVNDTSEDAAINQSKYEGWTLVESDPAFLTSQAYLWTVREFDNQLVYLSDMRTSKERDRNNITELTKGNLANQMTGVQLQTAVTALTQSNLQLTMDNAQLKVDRDTNHKAITDLTKEMMDLKLQVTTANTSNVDTETAK
ncbi:hypothetical protein [Companilactobacillus nantensis]|uniref:Uncharacterized protein n=1 Tax=Companilactobacillus nantensis DSM 16982 TaxID=1423774 RepID=A0A0R1WVT8_9LACO|nr:hypothetical protein [Companilactobacillus nantensis]KRM18476.1 hypothetical protein FD31_GL001024 [Companilactobacillus nantensis DSM 16982]GEO63048.1 hypothetical protein LNA01_02310 [Companilactobacillus nantensis]